MRNFVFVCIIMGSFLPSSLALAVENHGTMELIVPKSIQDMQNPNSKATKEWYPKGEPQGNKGTLWEQGTSAEELNRRRTPPQKDSQGNASSGINTRAGIETQLKNISEYERTTSDEPVTFADGRIRGDSSVEASSWKPAITEPIKIDEPILSSQHNVVGAYADMTDDEDFRMSAGPELHLPETMSSPLGHSSERPHNSELGMGMKLMWGF